MSIVEFNGGPITHRYLMNKSKHDLSTMYMDLLRCLRHETLREPEGWFLHSAQHQHTGVHCLGDTHDPLPHVDGAWWVEFQRYPTGGRLARGRGRSLAEAWQNARDAVAAIERRTA